jgi:hypothetical protein
MNNLLIETVPYHELADIQLVARAQDTLSKHFPNYTWIVGLNDEDLGGTMTIMNLEVNECILGCPNWGYVLKLSRVYSDPDLKCVMRAGGAILESANISRNYNKDEIVKSIDTLDTSKYIIKR